MRPIAIVYATHEGHTQRIAEHVAATVRAHGRAADVLEAARVEEPFPTDRYAVVLLASPVHVGKHDRGMVEFVKRHRTELERLPAAFLSVSLSEAGVEDATRPAELRAQAAEDVHAALETFTTETGWRPPRVKPVAGALLYTRYGALVRFVMRLIARKSGAPIDTTRDYVFTDWEALDRFVGEVLAESGAEPRDAGPPANA